MNLPVPALIGLILLALFACLFVWMRLRTPAKGPRSASGGLGGDQATKDDGVGGSD